MRALRVLQHQQQPALRCSPSRVVLDCLFARRVSSSIAAAAASRLPPPPPRPTTITSHPLRDHRRRPTIHLQTRTIFGFGGGGGGGKDKGPPQWEFPPGDPRRVPSTPAEHLARARPLLTPAGARSWARSHALGLQGVALLAAGAGALFYFAHRQTVPVSGRRRFNCYGEEAVRRVARAEVARVEYEVERAGSRFLPDWDPRAVLVRRVLRRLIPVSGAQDQEWEVRVIEAPGRSA
ncbi:hypothetical protein F4780DRAFT_453262 [Xylariomycetidae sp. FL0641]|nr:hypothetical protein F4780DRAFT_453262 [Xylariomycetidae sp. FL0641]